MDCAGVEKRSRAAKPGKSNADLWQQVHEGDPSRLRWHWIPSHKTEEEFIKACGEVNLWRQRANDLADEECKKYTSTLDIADREAGSIATADAQHRRMIEHLARRGQAVLRACGKDQPPVYAALGIIKPPAKGASA